MYKLVALDLDGTLLDDQEKIPSKNIEVIKELKNKEIHFVIVTGRSDSMTKHIVEELGIDAPILGNNGASIRNAFTKELLYLSNLSLDIIDKMHQYFEKNGSYVRWYGLDDVYSFNQHEFDELLNPYAKFSKRLAKHMNFVVLNHFDELKKLNPIILRCMYVAEDVSQLMVTHKELNELIGANSAEIFKASKLSLDVVARNTSKGNALKSYGESIGITTDEMIAIGDSGNDLSMLEIVGMPVTLENGDSEVKKIAKIISKSNNDTGVAEALINIFSL